MRRFALTILAALFLTGLLLAQSHARGIPEPVIYSGAGGGSFPYEPAKLKYSKAESGAGYAITFKSIAWANWGADVARGKGKISGCPSSDSCFVTDVVLKARKLQSVDTIGYYRKLVASFGQQRFAIKLPLP